MFIEVYSIQLVKSLIIVVVFLLLRWILIRLARRAARKFERLEHRTGLIIKYIDFGTIFLIILGLFMIWGVEFKDLGLVMSSVFAVIGIGFFAQWSILSNITSGVIMFFTFPYKIGDYVKIHDKEFPYEGTIEDIKTFHLIIKTNTNEIVVYPNSMTLQKGMRVFKPDEIPECHSEEEDLHKDDPID